MTLLLTLNPDSMNNEALAADLIRAMEDCLDLFITVKGDVYGPGTWQPAYGDPQATEGQQYSGGLNDPACFWGPTGTSQWNWMVNDHRMS